MLVKVLSRYVLGPSAVIATLAALGVFDDMTPEGGVPSSGNPAEVVLAALAKPLALAERIALAGGGELGFSPEDVAGLFDSIGSVDLSLGGGGGGGGGGNGGSAVAGAGAASISRHSGSAKTVRPPEPEPAAE